MSAHHLETLRLVEARLDDAIAAAKCHACGCFQQTVRAIDAADVARDELAPVLARSRETFVAQKYDCLGCPTCFPSLAAAAFEEAFPEAGAGLDLCPTQAPTARSEWPPLPGDYVVVRAEASVAVCTLDSASIVEAIATCGVDGLAIVGTMRTENLGIERLVQNLVANPRIRTLILCGAETKQGVGHFAGQSLESLVANGVDAGGRIVGAGGKRPVLKNIDRDTVERFRRQITLVSRVGLTLVDVIVSEIRVAAASMPEPFGEATAVAMVPIHATAPRRLVPDPAGYFVIYPDRRTRRLRVEHFANDGVLTCVIEGDTPAALAAEVIERGLVSRLDHAAYFGRELARAERSLDTGEAYVQDRAPGELDAPATTSCGCAGGCGGER
jgi:tetrahydromethanopterin S-methyltransferase subunit A